MSKTCFAISAKEVGSGRQLQQPSANTPINMLRRNTKKCQHIAELTLSTMSYTSRLTIRLNEVHETIRSLDIEDLVAELRLQDYENHPKESGEEFCAVCLSDFQCDEIIITHCKFMKRVTCGINSDKKTQSESLDRSRGGRRKREIFFKIKFSVAGIECTEDEWQEAQFYLYISEWNNNC
uniref:Uncharacterized protein n=1 Tax=Glossina austeni TaxID=7395 RepID=A0A1A9V9E1_GLOAU